MSSIKVIDADVAIVGGGGAGLRAAIAAADSHPELTVVLMSKVVPMRSHTVAAEGGSAGVITAADSFELHFKDTVTGGDWLCDQDVVEYFVSHCTDEMVQLEHWGCPWSRQDNGLTSVRNFGGMSTARTWFAADKTGFHILHTLFQTSMKYPSIRRLDEYFVLDLLVDDGRCCGLVAIETASGDFVMVQAKAVIIATGGAGRVYRQNTNAGIVTGDGMGMAYRHGVALRDMEFVQYHPTALPGSGVLITEGCRGEGGYLLNNNGYRYLQDYGLGPEVATPTPKTMELGPRDRLSQAFWHEQQQGRTVPTPLGHAVHLELMHLGTDTLRARLPFICELAETFLGIDPAREPIPVCPAVHYTMGGIATDATTATALPGLYACGECASVGIHGANRLGSNSLAELTVFGRRAGRRAAEHAAATAPADAALLQRQAEDAARRALGLLQPPAQAGERLATLRNEMEHTMDAGVGIFRTADGMQQACDAIAALRQRYGSLCLDDRSRAFNTEWLSAIELGFMLEVAQAMACSALARQESRGAHQRLDNYRGRDDQRYLNHTLACYQGADSPRLEYQDVTITRLPPAERVYGAAANPKADTV